MTSAKLTCVLGSQWGDEGKGKLVDILASHADLVARCQGGANAGHTIVVEGTKYHFHLLPCGLIHPNTLALIGHGVVIHMPSLFNEIEELENKGIKVRERLFISDRAHVVFGFHQLVDGLKEAELGKSNIGTTRRGIGPTYSAKASRSGIRIHQLFHWESFKSQYYRCLENKKKRYGNFEYDAEEELERFRKYLTLIRSMVVDGIVFMDQAIQRGDRILVEGANALLLDIDAGTYPFVTSSNCSVGGALTGLGIPPKVINEVVGVVKAYTTRVGGGPFPTELFDSVGETLCLKGIEYGTTTGRRRRCGWLDLVVLKHSNRVNGYTALNLTKLDVLSSFEELKIGIAYTLNGVELPAFPADLDLLSDIEVVYRSFPGWNVDISNCRAFKDLPINAQNYVKTIEEFVGIPIRWVGVGPSRDAIIEQAD